MNPQEIKELIEEIKKANQPALVRAQLLGVYLQAYHLSRISEELTIHRIESRKPTLD